MKPMIFRLVLVLVLVTVVATACSGGDGDWLNGAYTATGDDTDPDKVVETDVFQQTDDLNVVITLNSHNRDLQVAALFTDPSGRTYPTDMIEADETVGKVLLGLDFEQAGLETWTPGEWQVAVHVDEPKNKEDMVMSDSNRRTTIKFTVEAPPQPTE